VTRSPVRITGKRVIKALAGLLEEKLITAGDSGMGRAAAVAYAREGADADAAIDHFPSEDPDARKVVALIKAEGRKAIAIPGDLRMNSSVKNWYKK
jgi:NAD(P)-dependent dehydrogenase (short-subunit alcohol dehydrogenase family)